MILGRRFEPLARTDRGSFPLCFGSNLDGHGVLQIRLLSSFYIVVQILRGHRCRTRELFLCRPVFCDVYDKPSPCLAVVGACLPACHRFTMLTKTWAVKNPDRNLVLVLNYSLDKLSTSTSTNYMNIMKARQRPTVTLKSVVHRGDRGEHMVTIMMPEED